MGHRSYHEGMTVSRVVLLSALLVVATAAGCKKSLPESGQLTGTSNTLAVAGEYKRATVDSVERISIESGKLVVHGTSGTQALDLPPSADPDQQNKGWALVTEGEEDGARRLTFTHETSLDDFTIAVPASDGQIAYGSLGARDGSDVLLFAYGSASKTYWGWASIAKRAAPAQ